MAPIVKGCYLSFKISVLIDAVFWRGLFTIIVMACGDVDMSLFPRQPAPPDGKLVAWQVWLA